LSQLRDVGFVKIRESSYRGVLKLVHGVGFPNSLMTRLDRYSTSSLLARELYKLNKGNIRTRLFNFGQNFRPQVLKIREVV